MQILKRYDEVDVKIQKKKKCKKHTQKGNVRDLQFCVTVFEEEKWHFTQLNSWVIVSLKSPETLSVIFDWPYLHQPFKKKVYNSNVNISGFPCWQKSQCFKFIGQSLYSLQSLCLCCNSRWGPLLCPQHCRPLLLSPETLQWGHSLLSYLYSSPAAHSASCACYRCIHSQVQGCWGGSSSCTGFPWMHTRIQGSDSK